MPMPTFFKNTIDSIKAAFSFSIIQNKLDAAQNTFIRVKAIAVKKDQEFSRTVASKLNKLVPDKITSARDIAVNKTNELFDTVASKLSKFSFFSSLNSNNKESKINPTNGHRALKNKV